MAEIGATSRKVLTGTAVILAVALLLACEDVSGREDLGQTISGGNRTGESGSFHTIFTWLQKNRRLLFPHVWPEMQFGWRIVLGTVIGFLGAALGSVGGAGGGGIFVPMLILIIGFDPKSSTAISKCMVTGAALSTVYYNLKLRHPSLDLPIIDYNLALLFQPMLVLGVSIGVFFNVIFAEWMVMFLLILLFLVTSTKAFLKGVETWNLETITKKEAMRCYAASYDGNEEASYKLLVDDPPYEAGVQLVEPKVSIINNVDWMKLGILIAIWVIFLILQIAKDYTTTCSAAFWIVTLSQIPVAVGASGYQAVCLYKGWTVMESTGGSGINWTAQQLILCCSCGVLAGIVGGLLGLGGGFILTPLLLELGIPPQVSSATATLIMVFSSSMSVIQYHLLKRFPPSYALYFVAVATLAALVGQCVVHKMVTLLKRASIIIFVLAFVILMSAASLGYVGIWNLIGQVEGNQEMWFYNICEYDLSP
ncbi:sulfite exporter TauE/SafE family protein 3-like isoform X2 [Andrographis paniculata]|uniref:sulfite exporter TauE/SafE family protein 3-like isoform X2 n=1 Tax=Andrographis paniculata TaxID=175694 RepID=UPI0021E88D3F|nr:sulfite exporter TauE/SafE family protein 3-like isoform X2 [Andrographis paniculata]